ncbi:hypothetical protein CYMTET_32357 [Cymbomonas tetramitiformis]|uniref:Glycosyltransferase n=1 Tax=Cymbomonas tetramitiformis TaxID=36881 RepID=A0AAE0KSA6_9CHLO|nr:hypothetical protein CYMTET_32357 [Cymbomonas tetramitiformis]
MLANVERLAQVTSNIESYGGYSAALNAAYAKHFGYDFLISTDPAPAQKDARFAKVMLLRDALGGRGYDYALWIDADAILYEHEHDVVAALLAEYVTADLLFCRGGVNGLRPNLVNTGTIVARNTAWTAQFLEAWDSHELALAGRPDQEVFDALWLENSLEVQEHVALLPSDALNSEGVAAVFQTRATPPVIHLMGASTTLRRAVLAAAHASFCRSTKAPGPDEEKGTAPAACPGSEAPGAELDLSPGAPYTGSTTTRFALHPATSEMLQGACQALQARVAAALEGHAEEGGAEALKAAWELVMLSAAVTGHAADEMRKRNLPEENASSSDEASARALEKSCVLDSEQARAMLESMEAWAKTQLAVEPQRGMELAVARGMLLNELAGMHSASGNYSSCAALVHVILDDEGAHLGPVLVSLPVRTCASAVLDRAVAARGLK